MVPSIEFVTSTSGYNRLSALPEESQNRALMASVIHTCRCTADAKTLHEKSITYEAKFDLLCKVLQVNVPDYWYLQEKRAGAPPAIKPCKTLKIKVEIAIALLLKRYPVGYSMAPQLQSALATCVGFQVAS